MNAQQFFLLGVIVLVGCSDPRVDAPANDHNDQIPQVANPSDTVAVLPGFDSADAVTAMLEQRWSLESIKEFCILERRISPIWQNLVPRGEVWKGTLYANTDTGFDSISWYGTVTNGRIDTYSLGVGQGDNFWVLEIGTEESSKKPPVTSPDPNHISFIGHKNPIANE